MLCASGATATLSLLVLPLVLVLVLPLVLPLVLALVLAPVLVLPLCTFCFRKRSG